MRRSPELDKLRTDGTIDDQLRSLAKYSERLRVIEKFRTEGLAAPEAEARAGHRALEAELAQARTEQRRLISVHTSNSLRAAGTPGSPMST